MVQAAVADVVGPAVSAHDPDAFADQIVRDGQEVQGLRVRAPGELGLEGLHALSLGGDALFVLLRGADEPVHQLVAQLALHAAEHLVAVFHVLVQGEPVAEAELGVVLEEGVAPCRAPAVGVHGVGRGGQVAAVDGGAPRGVGDDGPVAEELAHELDIGRFAATRAGSRVLEEGLEELRTLHRVDLDGGPVHLGKGEEELVVLPLGLAQRDLIRHVEGLVLDVALVLGRTDEHAGGAPRAVLGRHLNGVLHALEFLALEVGGFVGGGRLLQLGGVVDLDADGGVGADQRALPALDADLLVPDGDLQGDVALFPLGRGRGESAVHGHGGHGEVVPLVGDDLGQGRPDVFGRQGGDHGGLVKGARGLRGHLDLEEIGQGLVHRLEVLAGRSLRPCRRRSS